MKIISGKKSNFAIEAYIHQAFERKSFLALGYLQIYVGGIGYGVLDDHATMLAASLQKINSIIDSRGLVMAPDCLVEESAQNIIHLFDCYYGDKPFEINGDLTDLSEVEAYIGGNHAAIHFGQDEAFDDGSELYYLPFLEKTRLIAARWDKVSDSRSNSIQDFWLPSDEFYEVLENWISLFMDAWSAAEKVPESEDQSL